MTDHPTDPGNTSFILPVLCPNCSTELNLAVDFALLPPKKEEQAEEIEDEL